NRAPVGREARSTDSETRPARPTERRVAARAISGASACCRRLGCCPHPGPPPQCGGGGRNAPHPTGGRGGGNGPYRAGGRGGGNAPPPACGGRPGGGAPPPRSRRLPARGAGEGD